jgi:MFS family permease
MAGAGHHKTAMQAREHFEHTVSWVRAHERHLSVLSLAGGFAFDSYAFGRIDRPATQAVFIVYLLVAGIAIAVLHALESRPEGRKPSDKTRAVLIFVTQFALGALLSGFCVFYIRSASITSSWPFLLAMAAIFIGNEYMRRYHSRLVFAALLLFFALYSYAIMLVPLVTGHIGPITFLISGGIAVVIFFFYMRALARLGNERYRGARMQVAAGMVAITAFLNVAYFLRILPPLPLVLTDAGVYHDVKRVGGDFQVTSEAEPPEWQALFGTHAVMHIQPGAKLYLFNAVFAPRGLRTVIVHDWQWLQPGKGWQTQQRIRVPILGGREDGYRYYTTKSAPRPGQWQVNIMTFDGRGIGRVRFAVEDQAVPPATTTKVLK